MEITVRKLDYNNLTNLNFTIPNKEIVGIIGDGKSTILKLLNGLLQGRGTIKYNNQKLTLKNKISFIKKVSFINSNFINQFLVNTVQEHMIFYMQYYKLNIKNPQKKLEDSLRIVGLNKTYLNRNINTLSTSEKKQLQFATALLTNPELILLDEPFTNLDSKTEKKLSRLLDQLNDRFNINIVIASNDCNVLYKYTKKIILVKDNTVLKEGPTKDIYSDVEYIIENGFDVPDIVFFTFKANTKKSAKIDYHRDIRDLIKDIYKHV